MSGLSILSYGVLHLALAFTFASFLSANETPHGLRNSHDVSRVVQGHNQP